MALTEIQFETIRNKLTCLNNALKNISEDIGSLPGGGGGGGGQNYNNKLDTIISELQKVSEIKTNLDTLISLHRDTNTSLTTLGNGLTEIKVKSKENTDAVVNKLDEVCQKLGLLISKFP